MSLLKKFFGLEAAEKDGDPSHDHEYEFEKRGIVYTGTGFDEESGYLVHGFIDRGRWICECGTNKAYEPHYRFYPDEDNLIGDRPSGIITYTDVYETEVIDVGPNSLVDMDASKVVEMIEDDNE